VKPERINQMKTGIITKNQSTFINNNNLNIMGIYHFSNPRKAALAASITLSTRGIRHELIKERFGRSFKYLLIDDTGKGVIYLKAQ